MIVMLKENIYTNLTILFLIVIVFFPALLLLKHPVILIVLGLLPFAAYLVLKFPVHMLLGFVIFSFFRIHEAFPLLMPFKFPLLLALASIAAVFFRQFISQNLRPYWSSELTLLTVFFLLVCTGILFAGNKTIAINTLTGVYVKIFVMVFTVAWMLRESKHFILASRLFCLAGLVVGCVANFNKVNSIGLVEGTRVTIARNLDSVLGDPNDLSLVLLFPAAYALATICQKGLSKKERWFGALVFVVLIFAILATQSRGGLLGVVSIIGFFLYQRIRSKVALGMIGAVALTILFAVAGIDDRQSGGAHEEGLDESAKGRLYAWEAAFGMAVDNPMLGVGISNFYYNYFFYSPHWDGLNHAVHSTWFGVLAETGFLGLGIFLSLIIITFRNAINTMNNLKYHDEPGIRLIATAVPAGIIGFMVSGTFLTQGFTWPLYIQIGLVVALSHFSNQQKPQESNKDAICKSATEVI